MSSADMAPQEPARETQEEFGAAPLAGHWPALSQGAP